MKSFASYDRDCAEKTLREAISMSVFCQAHPLTSLRSVLRKQRVVTSRGLRQLPSGSTVRVSGLLIILHTPPTKSGKRVMFLTLEDEMGLLDVVVFPRTQSRFAKLILTSEVLTIEGKLQRSGYKGKTISIIMERALVGLCGPLTRLLVNIMKVKLPPTRECAKPSRPISVRLNADENGDEDQLPLGFSL
ncbi:MAG: OB-fold nucleic acid binding domain-containing protein [Desulfomonilaceae bacterium]